MTTTFAANRCLLIYRLYNELLDNRVTGIIIRPLNRKNHRKTDMSGARFYQQCSNNGLTFQPARLLCLLP